MFKWLWRRLGFSSLETTDYDARYGYPKQAVAEWLRWNPQLAAEHQAHELRLQQRLDEKFGNSTDRHHTALNKRELEKSTSQMQ